jgi:hypothetical protein
MFLDGHCFTIAEGMEKYKLEFDQKKIDVEAHIHVLPPSNQQRVRFHVVRIGLEGKKSPTLPWLNGLGLKQQSYQRSIFPFLDFLVENNIEDDDLIENNTEEEDYLINIPLQCQLQPPLSVCSPQVVATTLLTAPTPILIGPKSAT